jgi:uncharacterized OsmC-like protein
MTVGDRPARVHVDLVEGLRFRAAFPELPDAAPLTLDEQPPLGDGSGPNPAALLAAAVGGCLAASMTFCLRKARATVQNVSADVTAHVGRNEAGRYRVNGIDVELSLEINEADRARFDRCEGLFEDFCIVTESVRQGIPVKVQLTSYRAEEAARG